MYRVVTDFAELRKRASTWSGRLQHPRHHRRSTNGFPPSHRRTPASPPRPAPPAPSRCRTVGTRRTGESSVTPRGRCEWIVAELPRRYLKESRRRTQAGRSSTSSSRLQHQGQRNIKSSQRTSWFSSGLSSALSTKMSTSSAKCE